MLGIHNVIRLVECQYGDARMHLQQEGGETGSGENTEASIDLGGGIANLDWGGGSGRCLGGWDSSTVASRDDASWGACLNLCSSGWDTWFSWDWSGDWVQGGGGDWGGERNGDGTRAGDWVGDSRKDNGCWCRTVGRQSADGERGGGSRVDVGLRAWAVGDGQGGRLSSSVSLVALNNSGWGWAVGGVLADYLSSGHPDRRSRGAVGWG